MKMIVGLGNPGAKYQDTRHNVGFEVAVRLARRFGCGTPRARFQGEIVEGTFAGQKVLLLTPLTYMNLSGKAVQAAPAAPAAVPAKPDVATKARKGTKVSAPTPAPVPTTAPVDPQPEKTIRRVASKRASLLKGRWIRLASNLDGG